MVGPYAKTSSPTTVARSSCANAPASRCAAGSLISRRSSRRSPTARSRRPCRGELSPGGRRAPALRNHRAPSCGQSTRGCARSSRCRRDSTEPRKRFGFTKARYLAARAGATLGMGVARDFVDERLATGRDAGQRVPSDPRGRASTWACATSRTLAEAGSTAARLGPIRRRHRLERSPAMAALRTCEGVSPTAQTGCLQPPSSAAPGSATSVSASSIACRRQAQFIREPKAFTRRARKLLRGEGVVSGGNRTGDGRSRARSATTRAQETCLLQEGPPPP